jgi:protease I
MKCITILTLILAGLAGTCLGQNESQVLPVKTVKLSEPRLTGPISLEETLARRRSVREFTAQKLDFEQIGQLAWAGQGITEKQKGLRTVPSAGAIYPISLYFVIEEGMFVYDPVKHSLEKIFSRDIRDKLSVAALNQDMVAKAACDIVVAGSSKKLAAKYGNKAERFMLLEAGHIAQNILLQAVSLELGSVPVGAFDINQVRKICKLPPELEPIYIICVGFPAKQAIIEKTEEETKEKKDVTMESREVKKAVLITASSKFRDEELFETKSELEKAGVETIIASTKTGAIRGMLGGRAKATILVDNIAVDDYDAIIFVGGSGAKEYFDNQIALNIAREAVEKQKVLAAICIAPAVLANAGVLDGVKATSFPSEKIRLKKAGAQYTGTDVEQDGLIITGIGPQAAGQFGKAVAEAIVGGQ